MNISFFDKSSFMSKSINPMMNLPLNDPNKKNNIVESFGNVLTKALTQVNDLQVHSDKMVQTMITEPGKVNIHDVTTLLSQAEMALSLTKAVTDRVVSAYREITNLR